MSALVLMGMPEARHSIPDSLCRHYEGLKVTFESLWVNVCVQSSPTVFGLIALSYFLLVFGPVICASTSDLFSATQLEVMKKFTG